MELIELISTCSKANKDTQSSGGSEVVIKIHQIKRVRDIIKQLLPSAVQCRSMLLSFGASFIKITKKHLKGSTASDVSGLTCRMEAAETDLTLILLRGSSRVSQHGN